MQLRLDHLILRSGDPAATLSELAERTGAPVLAGVEAVGPFESGIVRAGSVDIEVLRIGRTPPASVHGYGIGLTADVPLDDAVAELRTLGFPTSIPLRGVAGKGSERRTWRAVQVHGLLPDPFPAPVSTRRPGAAAPARGTGGGALGRVPGLARAAPRDPGRSMVVVTEYDFDAEAWRSRADRGPETVEAHVGAAGGSDAWRRLPLAPGTPLRPHDADGHGLTRVVLDGGSASERRTFCIGDVRFEVAL